MRIGRAGVYATKGGYLGVGAVVALLGNEALIAKDANSGTLIKFQRGQFATFDSCGMNPHAADKVRQAAGVTVGGRESISPDQAKDAIDFDNFEPLAITKDVEQPGRNFEIADCKAEPNAPRTSKALAMTGTEVHIPPMFMAAIRQVVKEMQNKKKPKPVQFIRDSTPAKTQARSKKTVKSSRKK